MPYQNRAMVSLRPDGKAALDRLITLLAPRLVAAHGPRISFADAIIEAERICRESLTQSGYSDDGSNDEPAQFISLRGNVYARAPY